MPFRHRASSGWSRVSGPSPGTGILIRATDSVTRLTANTKSTSAMSFRNPSGAGCAQTAPSSPNLVEEWIPLLSSAWQIQYLPAGLPKPPESIQSPITTTRNLTGTSVLTSQRSKKNVAASAATLTPIWLSLFCQSLRTADSSPLRAQEVNLIKQESHLQST